VWVVCMMVAVMEHKHGMWVWGLLLAACVLRCVAKIVMVEWQYRDPSALYCCLLFVHVVMVVTKRQVHRPGSARVISLVL